MPRPPAGATGVQTAGGSGPSNKIDAAIDGSKFFVVRELVDVGYLRNRFDKNPDAEPMRSLVIKGMLLHDGKAVEVSMDTRISFDPRATITKFLTAARGGVAPSDDEVVEFSEIIGKPIQVTAKSAPRSKEAGFWLRLSDPVAPIEGTPIPEVLEQYCVPTDEPFAWLEEELLAAIKRKMGPATQKGEEQESPPDRSDGAIAIDGSEITVGVWREVAPVLRRVLDDLFDGEITAMHDHFEEAMQGGDAKAANVLGFIGPKDTDPAAIVFKFGGRTDADAQDLKTALEAYEQGAGEYEGEDEPSGTAALEAVPVQPALTEADAGGDVEPGDLP
ncbi:hypothetical protein LCGC14_0443470 [marine sediment metagenome]|uniref:Uncharacterized protein n=1 Tax=marine sediment metagenome TaxID=412755 RepID=A0A0F9V6K2_9ZZZZ